MPKHAGYKKGGKRKSYGESHMDAGMSYKGAPQGYYDPGGKPMGYYDKPPNGYIDQAGMPNARGARKVLEHMSSYYSKASGARAQAGNSGGTYGSSSTNAGTSPNVRSMDSTYR